MSTLPEPIEAESPTVLLEKYATEAVACYLEAQSYAKQSFERTNDAVKSALLCGQALSRAQELCTEHGSWKRWLDKNWKYSRETARKWIVLANANHDWQMVQGKTIRQLYIEAGLVQEKEPEARPSKPFIAWFDETLHAFQVKAQKVETLEAEEKQTLGKVCAEIHKITGELCKRMGVE